VRLSYWVGLVVAVIGLLVPVTMSQAATCRDRGTCVRSGKVASASATKARKAKALAQANKKRRALGARASFVSSKPQAGNNTPSLGRALSADKKVPRGAKGSPVAIISAMAPSYGVPTWFALRIAKIESSYRANARGAAGEYGLFQMKCSTARGLGFRGDCGALLDARTNTTYGLKHLSQAIRRSGGNLRLAASKHNGGLGRQTLVPKYVRRVFG
jgi:soluble lytic murein transglycosylase-like protein